MTVRGTDPVLVLLAVIAGTSLIGVLEGPMLFVAAAAGALCGAGPFIACRSTRLLIAEIVAISLVAAIAVGAFVVGWPSPALGTFLDWTVGGWARLLTSVPPVEASGGVLALPFVLAWLGAVAGFAAERGLRTPSIAAAPPVMIFGVGLLFSFEFGRVSLVQGTFCALLSLLFGWLQQRSAGADSGDVDDATTIRRRRRTQPPAVALRAIALLAVIGVAAPLLTLAVPGLSDRERFSLHDHLEPPFDPLNEPSPLASLKGNLLDDTSDVEAFVVRGTDIPRRWRLATVGTYDGTVWNIDSAFVADGDEYLPIDSEVPADPLAPAPTTSTDRWFDVELGTTGGVWLPLPVQPVRLEVADDDAVVHYSAAGGAAAIRRGLRPGLQYRVQTAAPVALDLTAITLVRASPDLGVDRQFVPINDWTAEVLEGVDPGWAQVDAVRQSLIGSAPRANCGAGSEAIQDCGGFYNPEADPGHSIFRLTDFLGTSRGSTFSGIEEQYTAFGALALRRAGIATRIAVGYDLGEGAKADSIVVTRQDTTAWLEVLSEEFGWVPVDASPSRQRTRVEVSVVPQQQVVALPNPPRERPPSISSELLRDTSEGEEPRERVAIPEPFPWRTVALAGSPLYIPLLVVGGIVVLKALRRWRRSQQDLPHRRISAAWLEAGDRLAETGVPVRLADSPGSVIRQLETAGAPNPAFNELATSVDRSSFGRLNPTRADADFAWDLYRQFNKALQSDAPAFERLKRRSHLAPLRRKDPLR